MRIDGVDKRLLEARANIEFWYPDGDTVLFIPFFENPKIIESAAATYAEYNPLARAGSLFTYTGAQSRKFKIEALYTLPHLQNFDMGIQKYLRIFAGNTASDQMAAFFTETNPTPTNNSNSPGSSIALEAKKTYWEYRLNSQSPAEAMAELGFPTLGVDISEDTFINSLSVDAKDKAIDTILFFIAVFRSSILNNATNPLLGPPLARLNFGTLHNNIPCVVKSYNISWEEEAGYDMESLIPRQLKISLELHEVRIGDFGRFERNVATKRDNLAGWESVIGKPHTIAPGSI